jgi:hypothetical protein
MHLLALVWAFSLIGSAWTLSCAVVYKGIPNASLSLNDTNADTIAYYDASDVIVNYIVDGDNPFGILSVLGYITRSSVVIGSGTGGFLASVLAEVLLLDCFFANNGPYKRGQTVMTIKGLPRQIDWQYFRPLTASLSSLDSSYVFDLRGHFFNSLMRNLQIGSGASSGDVADFGCAWDFDARYANQLAFGTVCPCENVYRVYNWNGLNFESGPPDYGVLFDPQFRRNNNRIDILFFFQYGDNFPTIEGYKYVSNAKSAAKNNLPTGQTVNLPKRENAKGQKLEAINLMDIKNLNFLHPREIFKSKSPKINKPESSLSKATLKKRHNGAPAIPNVMLAPRTSITQDFNMVRYNKAALDFDSASLLHLQGFLTNPYNSTSLFYMNLWFTKRTETPPATGYGAYLGTPLPDWQFFDLYEGTMQFVSDNSSFTIFQLNSSQILYNGPAAPNQLGPALQIGTGANLLNSSILGGLFLFMYLFDYGVGYHGASLAFALVPTCAKK